MTNMLSNDQESSLSIPLYREKLVNFYIWLFFSLATISWVIFLSTGVLIGILGITTITMIIFLIAKGLEKYINFSILIFFSIIFIRVLDFIVAFYQVEVVSLLRFLFPFVGTLIIFSLTDLKDGLIISNFNATGFIITRLWVYNSDMMMNPYPTIFSNTFFINWWLLHILTSVMFFAIIKTRLSSEKETWQELRRFRNFYQLVSTDLCRYLDWISETSERGNFLGLGNDDHLSKSLKSFSSQLVEVTKGFTSNKEGDCIVKEYIPFETIGEAI